MNSHTILVIGGGGREHALCWKIAQSPLCEKVYCAPGNAGIAQDAAPLNVDVHDHQAVIDACVEHGVTLVVIGPEAFLEAGLSDALREADILVFGPSQAAAEIETSKGYMKDLCEKYDIPTAAYQRFTDVDEAKAYVQEQGAPIVVKADGLAAGKGVTVAQTVEEALNAVEDCLVGNAFGDAGAEVVIEEFMDGEEASFFALLDGNGGVVPLVEAQDHKAVGEGDVGPNTGGMGAYSPAPVFTPAVKIQVMMETISRLDEALREEGRPYQGVVFAGLMIKDGQAKIVEYNARFGDPECQVLMARMESDILPLLLASAEGCLGNVDEPTWRDEAAVCVVMATEGYPAGYAKNTPINGLDEASDLPNTKVFHAATAQDETGQWLSTGGRVLGVIAWGADIPAAQKTAYSAVDVLDWPQGFCRRDIGWRALKKEKAA